MLNKIYQKNKEAIDYLFWGVLTTVLNYILFFILSKSPVTGAQINNSGFWLNFYNTLVGIICTLFAFVTNRKFVFHSKSTGLKNYIKELSIFVPGRLGSIVMEDVIMSIGHVYFGVSTLIMKVIGEIFVIVFNYVWSKFAVFRKR
ncbi:GtrA family protein [Nicoliella spurrieriana]|uniref:GtrA family protein n=1 Tax=Nicoliella spurrieriana TaxID=2925830 RepID=A0A976RR84_9LACO|nr:GtrA family protein [Nicoliella spurrieriana]UQS86405.1 GtrA family protein [Nicoliella spurrieriana]